LIHFTPGDGPLHRAHPFTPFAVAGTLTGLSFLLPMPAPLVMLGVSIALVLNERVWTATRTAIVLALPFWMFLGLIHGAIRGDPVRAVVIGSRLTTVLVGFAGAIASVEPARLVEAMVAARWPFAMTFLTIATLQAAPRIVDRTRAIQDAQRCRGLRVTGSIARRLGALRFLSLPLILGSLAELDDRTVALETRGVRAGVRRTSLDPPRDAVVDRGIRWGGLAVVVAAAVWRIAA
jgi:energy-coupling factor transporter transmembrane protein EcfT